MILCLIPGTCILQLRKGVVWEDGETAQLIVGIAAASDEHIDILSALSEVVEDEEIVNELIHTSDANLILSRLSKPCPQEQGIEGMAQ
jgi:phosphocarrier protein FPr